MAQLGWIKLHRKIVEGEIWNTSDPFDYRSAWIDLLLLANHEDKTIIFDCKPVLVKRGQHLTSIRKLSERWHWSRNKVARYLDTLCALNMVTKDSDTRRTLLTLENYGFYQGMWDTDEATDGATEGTLTEPPKGHSRSTNKNIKNDKNEKNVKKERNNKGPYFENEDLNKAFLDFIEYRKKIKKPLATDRAITLNKNKLQDLAGNDTELAIQIIDQSIEKGWQGFFPLRVDRSDDRRGRQEEKSIIDKIWEV